MGAGGAKGFLIVDRIGSADQHGGTGKQGLLQGIVNAGGNQLVVNHADNICAFNPLSPVTPGLLLACS